MIDGKYKWVNVNIIFDKFMPKDEPYFIFEPKPGTGTVIENARKLVESLSTLNDEE